MEFVIAGVVSFALLAYLTFALIYPERF
ncbi:MAG: K(+)-transporting ATPase subunit F [Bdellovibrio sp.]|nr:MAG: K(+)-transporting ATPase subunit F [Bdellovibrio sp.]